MTVIYVFLLGLHNISRWLVLLAGLAALATALWGMFAKREFSPVDRATGVAFTSLFGLQVVLGLLLYFVSPAYGVRNLTNLTANTQAWFFGLYHIIVMLIALVVAQLGYSRAKRAETGKQAFRRAVLGYTAGFILMFLAIPWGFRPNWRSPIVTTPGAQHLTLTMNRTRQLLNLKTQGS